MDRRAVRQESIPYGDLPFKALSDSERQVVRPLIAKLRESALALLGGNIDAKFSNGIYIMGPQFANETDYRGAEVLVEKWRPQPHAKGVFPRFFSIAIYPDKTINRPNAHGSMINHYSDGSSEVVENDINENYEVPASEFQKVLNDLSECSDETLMPQNDLARYLTEKFAQE